MSFVLGVQPRVKPVNGPFLVKAVRAYVIGDKATEEAAGGGADCHSQAHGHWIVDTPISNPSSVFQDAKTSRKTCESLRGDACTYHVTTTPAHHDRRKYRMPRSSL